jgi:PAS domain S-box-containing protein
VPPSATAPVPDSVDAILGRAVSETARLLQGDGAMSYLLDDTGVLRFAHDAGITDDRRRSWVRSLKVEIGVGLFGRAVAEGVVVSTADYPSDPSFVHFPEADRLIAEMDIHSFVVAPMISGGRTFGAMGTFSSRIDAFGDAQIALVRALADHAAAAMANADLIEELAHSRVELERRVDAERALREIGGRIIALRYPAEVLQRSVDEAARLLTADGARIDLLNDADGALYWAYDATTGRRPGLGPISGSGEAQAGEGISGRAVRTLGPVFTGDYLADDRFDHADAPDEHARKHDIRSAVAVPLIGDLGPLGTLTVYSSERDAFSEDDARLLEALAGQAAIAMTNARLIEELKRSQGALERRAETERSLRDITARITSLRDPEEILARVVEESRRLLHSDGAHLTRMSDDGTYLIPVIVAGGMDADTEAWLRQMTFPLGSGINGLAAGEIEAIWTHDYWLDPRIPHEPDDKVAAERLGLRGMAAAPLRAPAGEVIGTLAVSYREPREFAPEELDLLQGLADQGAIALTNSNLYELLGESEARYRHLVQNSPDMVWSIDENARFSFVSDTSERLTGWLPEELLGKYFGEIVHESSAEATRVDWTANLTVEHKEIRGRLDLLHRDGHPIPAEFSAFGTLDAEGRFAGANGSVRDMSERDRLERELRESEERYRFLVENSPDVVFSTDADGLYTYYSETVVPLTGFRPGELVGRHFSSIVDLETFPDAAEAWQRFIDEPTRMQVNRFALRNRDGSRVAVEVSAVGMLDAEGRFAGIHGAARDIRERVRLETDLRRQAAELASSQERAHLARELHDSVTQALFSMTLVTRTTELLVDRDPAAAKEKLGSLRDLQREALAEMRALIFELRPGNIEQDGLLPALKTHSAALQGRIGLPIVVTSDVVDRLPLVLEEVLYRISQEALHNVVKHAAARQVIVSIEHAGAGIRLRIADDGKGFDAASVPEGHLGLAGMRARAEKIGASFAMISRTGIGTTIEVGVPEEAIALARAAEAASPSMSSAE